MKKVTIVFFVCLICIGSPVSAKEKFRDVSFFFWAHDDIEFLSEKGVIRGYTTGEFRPTAFITRKQAAIMLARSLDLNGDPVEAVIEEGLFHENRENFRPGEVLKRKDMAKALAKAYNLEGQGHSSFTDADEAHRYYRYIDAVHTYGISEGYNDGTFRPEGEVNRAQFSAFLTRVYQTPFEYVVREKDRETVFGTRTEAISYASKEDGRTVHPVMQEGPLAERQKPFDNGVLLYLDLYYREQMKAYISYKEEDGSYTGDLFDTFVILDRYTDSGRSYLEEPGNMTDYEDWKEFLDESFSREMIGAIDMAAEELGKVRDIYMMIPYPKGSGPIIDLDGKKVDNSRKARKEWIDWYIREVEKEWDNAYYDNLRLKGFYWANETVRSKEDELLLMEVDDTLEKKGYPLIYSPHSTSTNLSGWEEYGLEGAYLQPNAFRLKGEESAYKLHEAMQNLQIYNTNLNLELHSHTASTYKEGVENFHRYLTLLENYGLQEGSILVYQDAEQVHRLAKGSYPGYRELYRRMYEVLSKR